MTMILNAIINCYGISMRLHFSEIHKSYH